MSELLTLVESIAVVGTLTGKALEDKQINFKDLPYAFEALGSLQTMTQINFPALLESLSPANLTEEKKAEAVALFDAKFDLQSSDVEAKIEEAVAILALAQSVGVALVQLASRVKKLADSVVEPSPEA